ncbi:MAG: hypothetical protein ABJB22_01315, partial [Verrucomicrobiota bacterium]
MGAFPEIDAARQKCFDRGLVQGSECAINQASQNALREPLRSGVNRRDPAEMDRDFVIVLDHLKLRVLHAKTLA